MRKLPVAICLLVCGLALGASAESSEPQGVGEQARGGGEARQLDASGILENFADIVELLISDEERKEWEGLQNDEERQAFVVGFWDRRDPTPGTPDNEYRDTYMQRVAYAARSFREQEPGYVTDRGKVFICYGPPQEIELRRAEAGDESRAAGDIAGEQAPGRRTMMYWTMDTSSNPYLENKERLTFSSVRQGVFQLVTRLELSEEAFLAGREFQERVAAGRAAPSPRPAPTAAAGPPVAGEAGEALRLLMEEGVTQQNLDLQQNVSFFPAPGNATYTVIEFEVGKDGLIFQEAIADQEAAAEAAVDPAAPEQPVPSGPNAAMRAFGIILRVDPEAGEQALSNVDIPFKISEAEGSDGDSATHSFGVSLVPGNYRLAWGVMDEGSGRIATTSQAFEVPNYVTNELTITTVVAAQAAPRQVQDVFDLNTIYTGLRIGQVLLETDIDHAFDRDQTIELLYFVSGFQVDSNTQQPSLEIDHRILTEENRGIARLPTQTLNYFAVGQQIPLAQIREPTADQPGVTSGGSYKIRIIVRDLVAQAQIYKEIPFRVR